LEELTVLDDLLLINLSSEVIIKLGEGTGLSNELDFEFGVELLPYLFWFLKLGGTYFSTDGTGEGEGDWIIFVLVIGSLFVSLLGLGDFVSINKKKKINLNFI